MKKLWFIISAAVSIVAVLVYEYFQFITLSGLSFLSSNFNFIALLFFLVTSVIGLAIPVLSIIFAVRNPNETKKVEIVFLVINILIAGIFLILFLLWLFFYLAGKILVK